MEVKIAFYKKNVYGLNTKYRFFLSIKCTYLNLSNFFFFLYSWIFFLEKDWFKFIKMLHDFFILLCTNKSCFNIQCQVKKRNPPIAKSKSNFLRDSKKRGLHNNNNNNNNNNRSNNNNNNCNNNKKKKKEGLSIFLKKKKSLFGFRCLTDKTK